MLVVVDIDGTIANGERRFKAAGPEPERSDKEAYTKWVELVNSGVESDSPVPGMRTLCDYLPPTNLVYLTSREERLRRATSLWLSNHKFQEALLIMRPDGCWDSAALFKENAIKSIRIGSEDVIVIDDDEHGHIEDMCKRNSWTFLRARSGGQK